MRNPAPGNVDGLAKLPRLGLATGLSGGSGATTITPDPVPFTSIFIPDQSVGSIFPSSAGAIIVINQVIYVSNSTDGYIYSSTDAINWSKLGHLGFLAAAMAYNGSVIVAVGQAGSIATSPDLGATWTSRTSGTNFNIIGVAWSGSNFVAGSSNQTNVKVLTSDDGINWLITNLDNRYLNCGRVSLIGSTINLGIDPGSSVASGTVILTSTNGGASWTSENITGPGIVGTFTANEVTGHLGFRVMVSGTAGLWAHFNGSWHLHQFSPPTFSGSASVTYGFGYYASGFDLQDGLYQSPDGINFTLQATPPVGSQVLRVTPFRNAQFLAVTNASTHI